MKIDEAKIITEIGKTKPKTVLLSGPDGYLHQIQELATKIEKEYDVQTIISADPCYGSCDTADEDASRLGADLAFHIGHNSAAEKTGKQTVMVDIYDETDFQTVIQKSIPLLRRYRRLGLCTISQHLHRLDEAKKTLEATGFEVRIGRGRERLLDGQIMGCRFATVFNVRDKIDALIFLGQSRFHAVGAALATGRPTFMLDPYLETVEDMRAQAERWSKKAVLQLYRAVDAERFGIIIGLREGQTMTNQALRLRRRLQDRGKEARLITLREVTEDRLVLLKDVDAFVQTACPRISVDGETFSRPVLSVPQVEALFDLWEGRELGAFFERPSWI